MRRYFFDVYDGSVTLDDTGTELADLASARAMALGLLSDLTPQFPSDSALMEHRVIVRIETGKSVLEAMLTFRCVVLSDEEDP